MLSFHKCPHFFLSYKKEVHYNKQTWGQTVLAISNQMEDKKRDYVKSMTSGKHFVYRE